VVLRPEGHADERHVAVAHLRVHGPEEALAGLLERPRLDAAEPGHPREQVAVDDGAHAGDVGAPVVDDVREHRVGQHHLADADEVGRRAHRLGREPHRVGDVRARQPLLGEPGVRGLDERLVRPERPDAERRRVVVGAGEQRALEEVALRQARAGHRRLDDAVLLQDLDAERLVLGGEGDLRPLRAGGERLRVQHHEGGHGLGDARHGPRRRRLVVRGQHAVEPDRADGRDAPLRPGLRGGDVDHGIRGVDLRDRGRRIRREGHGDVDARGDDERRDDPGDGGAVGAPHAATRRA
jgi:hypothetical protein